MGAKKICVQKIVCFESKNFWVKNNLIQNFWVKILCHNKIWIQNNFGPKLLSKKNFRFKIILEPKSLRLTKWWSKNFWTPKKLGPKSLVNIKPEQLRYCWYEQMLPGQFKCILDSWGENEKSFSCKTHHRKAWLSWVEDSLGFCQKGWQQLSDF